MDGLISSSWKLFSKKTIFPRTPLHFFNLRSQMRYLTTFIQIFEKFQTISKLIPTGKILFRLYLSSSCLIGKKTISRDIVSRNLYWHWYSN